MRNMGRLALTAIVLAAFAVAGCGGDDGGGGGGGGGKPDGRVLGAWQGGEARL